MKMKAALPSLTFMLFISIQCHAQGEPERTYVLGHLVQFSTGSGGEKTNFDVISVKPG